MNRILRHPKTNSMMIAAVTVFWLCLAAGSGKLRAFNNNNGRNLPFCDTTMTPSWDPPGVWMEWCGRRWFVPDNNPGKTGRAPCRLGRTFYEKKARREQLQIAYQTAVSRLIRKAALHRAAKPTRPFSNIEITYEDMRKAYTHGSDFIESYAFPKNVMMDLGIVDPDLTTPQHWTLPAGLDFSTTLTRKILDPKDTPHSGSAPEATHCLYVQSPNRGVDVYEYYLLDEDGLWLEGEDAAGFNYSDYTEDEIMTLPLDIDTDYQSGSGELENWQADGDTTWYDDTTYDVDAWYYWSEGYGTLDTPDDGPVEVIKIAYQWVWSEWEVDDESGDDVLLDFDNGTEIYFYSKDGHQLMISIDSLGVDTGGLLKPDAVYYQKVRHPGASVREEQSAAHPGLRAFPNPTGGMVHFNQPASFEIFDVLGRRVLNASNALTADLSGLPRGLYFVKPRTGPTQKILLQN